MDAPDRERRDARDASSSTAARPISRASDDGKTNESGAHADLVEPHRFAALADKTWTHVAGGAAATHCAAIDDEGRLYTWGRNERGQLGHGDYVSRGTPTRVEALGETRCASAACGKGHTVVVCENGDVYGFGSNKFGQFGMRDDEETDEEGGRGG